MADSPTTAAPQSTGSKERPWHPRFWSGFTIRGWLSLLARNRFAITPRRMAMAAILTALAFFNFIWCVLQIVFYGRRIGRTEIKEAPIFIVGHWRSGTTMLHEMMILDHRHTYADTFNCFTPNHFLASGWLFRPALRFLLPARRPMDNMAAGWGRPQEDEFALCNMGVRSPYLTLVFPNRPPQDQEYFELAEISQEEFARWRGAFLWFLKCITVQNPRRIVLKSPPHTFRIKRLLEIFPDARFIHVVRNPYELLPSTIKMWKSLYRSQGLQVPRFEGLEQYVLETGRRMYEVFERDRHLIPPSHIAETHYEDLVRDPIGEIRKVYEQLELGGFDESLPTLEQYVDSQKDYKANVHEISEETRAGVEQYWGAYLEKYGYAKNESE